MKKCIVLLFALALVLSAIPALTGEVKAYDDGTIYYYSVSNGEAKITSVANASGAIKIPSSLGGYPVTSIGEKVFCDRTGITEITIPNTITSIGSKAFLWCRDIERVNISDMAAWCRISFADEQANPLSQGARLYLNDTLVQNLVIPDGVTSIGDYAFPNLESLTGVTIPNSVTSIGEEAFSHCWNLTVVTIPNSVTRIGVGAFSGCSRLMNVTIPNSITCIEDSVFDSCDLRKVVIPNSVTSIGYRAFYCCSHLTEVTIPDSVTHIGNSAFLCCHALTDVILPNSITSVGDSTFGFCENLISITIPASVTDIQRWAFEDCDSLQTVNYLGYRSDRQKLNIASDNDPLINAQWNYAVCTDGHSFDHACDAVCNVCDEVRTVGDHVYTNSCDTTCNECGFVRTITHTYDNESDLTCNVCKESLTPPAPTAESFTYDSITLVAIEGLEYRCENGSWQNSNVFTGLQQETEYRFYQRVAASNTAQVSEASSALYAYTRSAPPTVQSKTDTSITINLTNSLNDVSLDGINWFTSSRITYTFTNLKPGTTYTVYQRRNSAIPAGMVEVTTYRQFGVSYDANGGSDAPADQTKVEQTPLTLSADQPTRTGYVFMGWATTFYGEVTYQPQDSYTQDADLTLYALWGISCTTCGGDGDNGTKCDNCNGTGRISYTDKACPSCSSFSITQHVTGYYGSYYECRWCGDIFYSPKTVTSSRSCSYCSGSGSIGKSCSACDAKGWIRDVHKTAPAPTLASEDYVSVTLKKLDGVEYSIDGNTWQDSNVFTQLAPGTTYRFYQRYKETSTHKPITAGEALTVTTKVIPANSVTLKKVSGVWKCYIGNTFVPITTVVTFSGSRYYAEDGVVPSAYTGWKNYKSQKLYIKSGKLAPNGLHKVAGSWYYIKEGALASNVTSLVKYNDEWFYVKNGKVASDVTTLVKLNGEWFYVVKGKMAGNTTGLIKYNGEWWYVVKGKIAGKTTTLVKYNNEWWYVIKGKVAGNTTTLVKYNGGWYYMVKGKLAAKATTLVKFNGSWYYVENGKVNFSKTGLVSYNGGLYYIEKGVKSSKTAFVSHNGKQYYVKSGVAQTGVSGAVSYGGKTYYLNKGILTNCHTAGHSFAAATCTKPKTCTKCTVTNGKPKGHSIVEPTCTQKGTCRVCGIVVSESLGHSFAAATCTKPKTCTRCAVTDGKPKSHTLDDEYCTHCGWISGVYIKLPQLPHKYNQLTYSGEIAQTCEITGITLQYTYTSDGLRYYNATLTGTCTYINSSGSSGSMYLYYKIYDSDGVLIDSDSFLTDSLALGDKFRKTGRIWIGLEEGKSYTLVFYNN